MGLSTELVAGAALGYALGSIPFGFILTRMAGLGDIRAVGSGNIGATNVLRTGRKDIAALTLLLDGGKGVATGLGVFLAWSPTLFLFCAAVWLGGAWLTRLSSAAALLAFALAPAFMLLFRPLEAAVATLAVTAVMVWRHTGNIRRLLNGTEPRIGAAK